MNQYEIDHLSMLRKGNSECTLFLNRDNTFPLKEACDIALYGNGVRHTIKGGTGSGEVNSRFFVNVEEGFKNAGFNILTNDWLDEYDIALKKNKEKFKLDIKQRAKEKHTIALIESMGAVMVEGDYDIDITKMCETAIYVLSRNSGEGNDRLETKGDVLLTDSEVRDILKLNEMYEKFMLVINTGGPVDLSEVKGVKNILVLSQLGVETGSVLADIVLGKSYPSGKLTTTWARACDYQKIGDFGDRDETYYKEGIYVGYRYFDSVFKEPLYAFGYGKGYTDFELGNIKVSVNKCKVNVETEVKNIGNFMGKEVVQAYLSCPWGKLDKPFKDLVGFVKTGELNVGEKQVVSLMFDIRDIASFDEENDRYVLEKGEYILKVGNSSDNTVDVCSLMIKEDVVTRSVRKITDKLSFKDYVPNVYPRTLNMLEVIELDLSDVKEETYEYEDFEEVDELIKSLSDEELVYMNIGAFKGNGLASVIGNAGFDVAGTAGQSVMKFREKGIPSIVMSDGPAGIRISRQYYEDEKGVHGIGAPLPETMLEMLPKFIRGLIDKKPKLKEGTVIKEHYATAIPIGTAIAQSFNEEFAQMCGDIVGSEMEMFGINLWLAPALNIHRDIKCGRNFEYYSEDPFVSGKIAAYVTKGVQKHKGCGVTIKHYFGNNQETNRYNNNSHISIRALRELYLKGFEICIKEAKPYAVMSSYNLVNGVHTSERRDFSFDVLRNEFGFNGILMTDWVTGGSLMYNSKKYPMPNAGKVAKAGGDLFMPGGKDDYKKCLKMLKSGELSRLQLEKNASRVLRVGRELNCK